MGISKTHIHSQVDNDLALIAKVFAHPARIAIINYIASSKGCLCKDIANHIQLSQPTTTQHLQVIRRVGVLDYDFVGATMYYRLNKTVFAKMKLSMGSYFEVIENKISKKKKS
ncbi:metalloregulator ArsR/SmtB family transcription factor [Aequorivita sp. KMM 9714]|uniref:ArsR/SmtB family transcription factor n=1 Tax=Aequorivita sp. KMM 9714 TaxID=2707173 RepID=UPI0013EA110D|nr:metalloregulator ArsR/SmtB family transcription factor [Aequorivita sp. KMM 9714]NGX83084.1 winged helix-turn-helix transcriptional regulator [Aequorivita sp. KMM 9714]